MPDIEISMPVPTEKLMAVNRGEIAIRIFRAATELGLRTVAIYAEEDRFSRHRFKADEAYRLRKEKGPVGAYLDIEGIIHLAKEKGVTLIHPGYGFLSENAAFARACREAGLTFVGPDPEMLDVMGDKVSARALAARVDVPTLPGTEAPVTDRADALRIAREIGFPLIIKAAFGGGGWATASSALNVAALSLDARIAQARGEHDRAVKFWQQAVAAADQLPYDEPPVWFYPVRESLGGTLLAIARFTDAERVFREDLVKHPRNARSLFGLQIALAKQGREAEAALVRTEFEAAWKNADTKLTLEDF